MRVTEVFRLYTLRWKDNYRQHHAWDTWEFPLSDWDGLLISSGWLLLWAWWTDRVFNQRLMSSRVYMKISRAWTCFTFLGTKCLAKEVRVRCVLFDQSKMGSWPEKKKLWKHGILGCLFYHLSSLSNWSIYMLYLNFMKLFVCLFRWFI